MAFSHFSSVMWVRLESGFFHSAQLTLIWWTTHGSMVETVTAITQCWTTSPIILHCVWWRRAALSPCLGSSCTNTLLLVYFIRYHNTEVKATASYWCVWWPESSWSEDTLCIASWKRRTTLPSSFSHHWGSSAHRITGLCGLSSIIDRSRNRHLNHFKCHSEVFNIPFIICYILYISSIHKTNLCIL